LPVTQSTRIRIPTWAFLFLNYVSAGIFPFITVFSFASARKNPYYGNRHMTADCMVRSDWQARSCHNPDFLNVTLMIVIMDGPVNARNVIWTDRYTMISCRISGQSQNEGKSHRRLKIRQVESEN
jgi:hypothetical protein